MKKKSITVIFRDKTILEFDSASKFSKHLAIGISRLNKALKGRNILNQQDYEELQQLAFAPRNWDHAFQNAKKKDIPPALEFHNCPHMTFYPCRFCEEKK